MAKTHTHITTQSDQELHSLYVTSGDTALVASIYVRYTHLILGVCKKYLQDIEESKDATTEIFEKICIELKKNTAIDNMAAWLHVVTRNHCLMKLRKTGKTTILSENGIADMESIRPLHHEDKEEKEYQLDALDECMKTLSPEQNQAVALFYIQNKCYQEVSELTGYDMSKVKSYIQNGKRNLKICIEQKISLRQ